MAAGDNIPLWFELVLVAKSKKIDSIGKYVSASPCNVHLLSLCCFLCAEETYLSLKLINNQISSIIHFMEFMRSRSQISDLIANGVIDYHHP